MAFGRAGLKHFKSAVPAGLVWVDGIHRRDGQWSFETICLQGGSHVRRPFALDAGLAVPLADIESWFYWRRPLVQAKVEIDDLSRTEVVFDPKDVLGTLVPGIQASQRHQLVLVSRQPNVYVPSLLLMRELFAGVAALNRSLLVPNAIDLFGVASVLSDAVHIYSGPGFERRSETAGKLARILAWAHTSEDGRRAHASVLRYARRGQIAFDLPVAQMRFWAIGYQLEVGLLATEIGAVDIELPIPRDEVVVHDRGKVHEFRAYEPKRLSPWSSQYEEA